MYYPGAFGRQELKVTLTPWPTHEYCISFWQPIMIAHRSFTDITLQELWGFVVHDVLNYAPYPEMFEELTWENFVN